MLFLFINLSHAAPLQWNTSYTAQAWHPGVKLGVELELTEAMVEKTRQERAQTITRQILIEPSFTAWYHRHNHIPLTLSNQLIARWIRPDGKVWELLLGQGVTYAINDGETCEFDSSDDLVCSNLAGNWMSATTLGFGLGRDLSVTSDRDLAWHIRPSTILWAPYNSGFAPVFMVELGVRRAWQSGGTR
jgi:hypothetical protein